MATNDQQTSEVTTSLIKEEVQLPLNSHFNMIHVLPHLCQKYNVLLDQNLYLPYLLGDNCSPDTLGIVGPSGFIEELFIAYNNVANYKQEKVRKLIPEQCTKPVICYTSTVKCDAQKLFADAGYNIFSVDDTDVYVVEDPEGPPLNNVITFYPGTVTFTKSESKSTELLLFEVVAYIGFCDSSSDTLIDLDNAHEYMHNCKPLALTAKGTCLKYITWLKTGDPVKYATFGSYTDSGYCVALYMIPSTNHQISSVPSRSIAFYAWDDATNFIIYDEPKYQDHKKTKKEKKVILRTLDLPVTKSTHNYRKRYSEFRN